MKPPNRFLLLAAFALSLSAVSAFFRHFLAAWVSLGFALMLAGLACRASDDETEEEG